MTSVAVHEPHSVDVEGPGGKSPAAAAPGDLTALLTLAVDRNVPVETIEKLITLHERVADRAAAQEFAAAMADFQRTCPPIKKTSEASIATKSGTKYRYTYAELDEIARTVNPLLSARGLSYTWDTEFPSPDRIRCVATVRHVNGHKVTAAFELPVENASAMSDQQKVGAALTYARRQSLVQALGLTTTDDDTDAQDPALLEPITDDQVAFLSDLITEHRINREKFLAHFKVRSLAEIKTGDMNHAVDVINQTVAKRTAGGKTGPTAEAAQ